MGVADAEQMTLLHFQPTIDQFPLWGLAQWGEETINEVPAIGARRHHNRVEASVGGTHLWSAIG